MSNRAWRRRRAGLRGRCASRHHRKRTLAVSQGTFRNEVNPAHDRDGIRYCARCAWALESVGFFFPEQPLLWEPF